MIPHEEQFVIHLQGKAHHLVFQCYNKQPGKVSEIFIASEEKMVGTSANNKLLS